MSQVQRTTNALIDAAFRLLSEVGADEPVDGTMQSDALYILNELLDQFSVSKIYVPFVQEYTFPFTQGKGSYTFSNVVPADITADRIIGIDYANYVVNDPPSDTPIVYALTIINKSQYYNITRLQNLQTRPGFVFLDNQNTISTLTFYPVPDQNYLCTMGVKFMLDKLTINTVITTVPPYFQRFLRYALVRELKKWYPSGNWEAQDEEEYQRMFHDLRSGNEMDMTITPSQILVSPRPFYWPNIIAL